MLNYLNHRKLNSPLKTACCLAYQKPRLCFYLCPWTPSPLFRNLLRPRPSHSAQLGEVPTNEDSGDEFHGHWDDRDLWPGHVTVLLLKMAPFTSLIYLLKWAIFPVRCVSSPVASWVYLITNRELRTKKKWSLWSTSPKAGLTPFCRTPRRWLKNNSYSSRWYIDIYIYLLVIFYIAMECYGKWSIYRWFIDDL